MKELLNFPFDGNLVLRKKRAIKKALLQENRKRVKKNIAILCGSTANDIKDCLELFLLNQGIEPSFYLSEYNRYWEDVMFDNPELVEFKPDIIFIHTSMRNISDYPNVSSTEGEVQELLQATFDRYEMMWSKIADTYHCPVIQNNFEPPLYRLLGNSDIYNVHGRYYFINQLNEMFYRYAREHDNFFINDIAYQAADYGLKEWQNPSSWYLYKYIMAIPAIPAFSYNLANIIKSIYGKNNKAFVLDLDNTLWGGIVGDDGPEHIEIGQETAMGQVYAEFQSYVKQHKDIGILLNIDSKNEESNAIAGLSRPDSVLQPEDFLVIKANWNPKDLNITDIASEINIGADSLVFIDDNPVERHIVKSNVPGVAVPEVGDPNSYIQTIDRAGYFEVTNLSNDDLKRNTMYKANIERVKQQKAFENYSDYLKSLEMKAEISAFKDMYIPRIAQLTNKSNQFNLTTKRCTQAEIESFASDDNYITEYGRLIDKFGDNGVVAVTFGHIEGTDFHIDLWLMSCRVLKRDMENAMLDNLVSKCKERNVEQVYGYYYPTEKNGMVKEFYGTMGFEKVSEEEDGSSVWKLPTAGYENRNEVIELMEE